MAAPSRILVENPTDRGTWQATVHRVAKSWTRLKWLSTHTQRLHVNPVSGFAPPPTTVATRLFSTSVILRRLANKFAYTIFLGSTYSNIIQYSFFSFWLTSLCMKISRSIHISARGTISFQCCLSNVCVHAQSCSAVCDPMACSPLGSSVHEMSRQEYWSGLHFLLQGIFPTQGLDSHLPFPALILHCIYVPHLLHPFLGWWTFRLLLCPDYYTYCYREHRGACILSNYDFLWIYA